MLKKVTIALLVLLAIFLLYNGSMVVYLAQQGQGQVRVILDSRPISELKDEGYFDEVKLRKLSMIEEMRDFAFNDLGLDPTGSFTDYYEQNGKPVLWVLNACPPFSLEAYKWNYPVLGKLGYKGFFEKTIGLAEEQKLIDEGYDTDLGPVNAWSTLGWLNDPVLSSMLNRSEGELARLVIHELTHASVYISGDGSYNENLATFIGDKGAILYLRKKYGDEAIQLQDLEEADQDRKTLTKYLTRRTEELIVLYASDQDNVKKRKKKKELIRAIQDSIPFLSLNDSTRFQVLSRREGLNNAFFTAYSMYREGQSEFQRELEEDFEGDLVKFIEYQKSR